MAGTPRFDGIPEIIYGTAFKFEESATLVKTALNAGFRAIDTAGSTSAYREALVGEGIAAALASGNFERKELYIQTKFSPFKPGKDPALYPYDTTKSIPEQVEESVTSSLANLGDTYIDSLVLHSLYADFKDTLKAWRAMEAFVPFKVSSLGVSDIDVESLRQLCEVVTIKPRAVQNRFTQDTADHPPNPAMPPGLPHPQVAFDRDVREYCQQHGIAYAPWGILWGSLDVLDGSEHIIEKAAHAIGVSKAVACYAGLKSLGGCQISILCGTTKEVKMHEALAGPAQVQSYLAESEEHREDWKRYVDGLRAVIDVNERRR